MKSSKEWISISDMMTGLMMIFLFISILYMDQTQKKIDEVKKITAYYTLYKNSLYKKIKKEFQRDLKKWDADIIEDSLVIRFLSPDIMFDAGSSVLKKKFKNILDNFCPRYFNILYSVKANIEEIRIEGHTSTDWQGVTNQEAYFKNMQLSQDRTRAVLRYCTSLKNIRTEINKWAVQKLTANGLSSMRPICHVDTLRCRHTNRRVGFRIQIHESNSLNDIIKSLSK